MELNVVFTYSTAYDLLIKSIHPVRAVQYVLRLQKQRGLRMPLTGLRCHLVIPIGPTRRKTTHTLFFPDSANGDARMSERPVSMATADRQNEREQWTEGNQIQSGRYA
ncbi:hypothetical protein F2P81_005366 [Scophthalmus maximus]|uniref:Uncharacterized protein n=1 Tax=Scophthalmus maximus TaxID=52904 RepID=A0A6A4TF31_SCOMX|nr:hypothetical protein F2P81_005366 [Scophthalmus maximus]